MESTYLLTHGQLLDVQTFIRTYTDHAMKPHHIIRDGSKTLVSVRVYSEGEQIANINTIGTLIAYVSKTFGDLLKDD